MPPETCMAPRVTGPAILRLQSWARGAPARLDEFERLTGERGLLRHEEAEAAMAVFTGAAEEHQQLRPTSECAPELGAVDAPTVAGPLGAAFHRRDVRSVVRFGHRDRDHLFARRDDR